MTSLVYPAARQVCRFCFGRGTVSGPASRGRNYPCPDCTDGFVSVQTTRECDSCGGLGLDDDDRSNHYWPSPTSNCSRCNAIMDGADMVPCLCTRCNGSGIVPEDWAQPVPGDTVIVREGGIGCVRSLSGDRCMVDLGDGDRRFGIAYGELTLDLSVPNPNRLRVNQYPKEDR